MIGLLSLAVLHNATTRASGELSGMRRSTSRCTVSGSGRGSSFLKHALANSESSSRKLKCREVVGGFPAFWLDDQLVA